IAHVSRQARSRTEKQKFAPRSGGRSSSRGDVPGHHHQTISNPGKKSSADQRLGTRAVKRYFRRASVRSHPQSGAGRACRPGGIRFGFSPALSVILSPSFVPGAATCFVIAYLAFFPVDALFRSRLSVGSSANPPLFAALLASVHFLMFVSIVRFYSAVTDRDAFFLAMLSFAGILAAAVLTV